jgi:hypothetical protein
LGKRSGKSSKSETPDGEKRSNSQGPSLMDQMEALKDVLKNQLEASIL